MSRRRPRSHQTSFSSRLLLCSFVQDVTGRGISNFPLITRTHSLTVFSPCLSFPGIQLSSAPAALLISGKKKKKSFNTLGLVCIPTESILILPINMYASAPLAWLAELIRPGKILTNILQEIFTGYHFVWVFSFQYWAFAAYFFLFLWGPGNMCAPDDGSSPLSSWCCSLARRDPGL